MVKATSCIGILILGALAVFLSAVVNGWALSVMWGWFVVPQFSLPPLSIPAAIGVSMVVGMLTHQEIPNEKEQTTGELIVQIVTRAIFTPLLIVCVGWIVKLFM